MLCRRSTLRLPRLLLAGLALALAGCASDPPDENFPTSEEGLRAAIKADRARIEEIVSQPDFRESRNGEMTVLTPELVELNIRLVELNDALEAIRQSDASAN